MLQCWLGPVAGSRPAPQQTDGLAALDLHAQLQAFEPVQVIDTLLADLPAFAPQHNLHAQISESWTVHGDLPDT